MGFANFINRNPTIIVIERIQLIEFDKNGNKTHSLLYDISTNDDTKSFVYFAIIINICPKMLRTFDVFRRVIRDKKYF